MGNSMGGSSAKALQEAACVNDVAKVKKLLAKLGDKAKEMINKPSPKNAGMTAMHEAARYDGEVLKLFLAAGGDPNAPTKPANAALPGVWGDVTPLFHAINNGIYANSGRGENREPYFPQASVSSITLLLEAGADIDRPAGQFESTPLMAAIMMTHPMVDRNGVEALDMIKALHEAGADLSAKNSLGNTAADSAKLMCDEGTEKHLAILAFFESAVQVTK
jgi:ankyrin repeat protein